MDRIVPVKRLYTVEGFSSVGGNLMQVGIFFYTQQRFGWGLKENFSLAAVQGIVYVLGALTAQGWAGRFGRRNVLVALYALLCAIALSTLLAKTPVGVVAALLAYAAIGSIGWPILESMVSSDVDARLLAKRISTYNVVWAATGALAIAINGAVIDFWAPGVFVLTAIVHGVSGLILLLPSPPAPPLASSDAPPHLDPEPELIRVRTVAMWLSRISLPASYALVYAVSALLPSIPALKQLPTWAATLVGSTWLVSRCLTFLALGMHDWWHTRPRVLLFAAWLMLASFVGVGWTPSNNLAINLAWLIVCQVVIGIALGLIYSGSLYFGMVLSEGSTEHGGYHEALIGLGSVLGPGAGAIAQWLRPGDVPFGIAAVSAVLFGSGILANGASIVARRRRPT